MTRPSPPSEAPTRQTPPLVAAVRHPHPVASVSRCLAGEARHERKMDLTVLCAKCHEHFHHITGGAEKRLKSAPKPRKQPKRPHHLRPLKGSPEAYQPKVPRPNAKMRELVERSVKEWPKGEPFNAKPIARRVRERDRKHKITDALVARALEWFEEQGELERIGGQRWQR